MRNADGTYTPEGIKKGTKGCCSCLDPVAETVRFTDVEGGYMDICLGCISAATALLVDVGDCFGVKCQRT